MQCLVPKDELRTTDPIEPDGFVDTFKQHSITFIMSRFAVYIKCPISITGVNIARVCVHIKRFNNYYVLLVTNPRQNLWKIRTVIVR